MIGPLIRSAAQINTGAAHIFGWDDLEIVALAVSGTAASAAARTSGGAYMMMTDAECYVLVTQAGTPATDAGLPIYPGQVIHRNLNAGDVVSVIQIGSAVGKFKLVELL